MLNSILLIGILSLQVFAQSKTNFIPQLKQLGSCCAILNQVLPGKVFQPGSTTYASSQSTFYTALEQGITPACIVRPTNSIDVSAVVALVAAADVIRSSAKDCNLAVRSGGHTPWAGAGNIPGGITVDLQTLDGVEIVEDRKTARLGAGNRWSNIYPKLEAQQLAMVGGRISPVGAGGLITGGGISYFTPRKGFACDNVINYELVTATGAILNVNAGSHPKLYRALKGGSNNFGIVTRFDVAVFDQGDLWGGILITTLANRDAQFSYFTNFTRSETYDPYASLIVSYGFGAGVITGEDFMPVLIPQYTKPEPFPEVYKPLTDAPQVFNTFRIAPLSNMTDELAAGDPILASTTRKRFTFTTLTYKNNLAFMHAAFDLAAQWRPLIANVTAVSGAVNYQPIPALVQKYAAERGGNVLGLKGRTDLVNFQIGVAWEKPEDDYLVYGSLKELFGKLNAKAKEMGVFDEYVYLNYAAEWQRPIEGYGRENVEFLKKVSRQYDPRGFFQRRLPGGFKLDD